MYKSEINKHPSTYCPELTNVVPLPHNLVLRI
jgi:hypothetical protein